MKFFKTILLFFVTQSLLANANLDTDGLDFSFLGFEENKGQLADAYGNPTPEILFRYHENIDIYITNKGLSYVFIDANEERTKWNRIDMQLQGVDLSTKKIRKEMPSTQGYVNYYLAHCPEGVLNVNSYRKIVVENVYDKIDWVIYALEGQVKHDFVVHPGGDPSQIKFNYEGAEEIVNHQNSLTLKTPLGEIVEGELYCYQTIDDNRYTISSAYKKEKTNFEYQISNIKEDEVLVIDPPLQWGTLYCDRSSANIARAENLMDMTIDATGSIYIAGMVSSYAFPTFDPGGGAFHQGTPGFINPSNAYNACVLKFDNNGARLWATYYGGATYDEGRGIALDNNNNIVVTGFSQSSDFPTFDAGGGNYYQAALSGFQDAFILKFSNTGVRQWATYYGGTESDWGIDVACNSTGNMYMVGYTASTDFQVNNPGGGAFYQGTNAGGQDAFIVEFSNTNQQLWSTYVGGDGVDHANAVTISNDEIVFTGRSSSTNYPTNNFAGGYFQGAVAGNADIVLTRFDATRNMKWSTYYGGGSMDDGHAIHIDNGGQTYITGFTYSTDFPLQNSGGFMQNTFAGGSDMVIVKFDANLATSWSTFYGGDKNDLGYGITTDPFGNMFMNGYSMSTNMTTFDPGGGSFFQGVNNGFKEQFIARFDGNDNMTWGTYYGGDGNEEGNEIVTDMNGCPFTIGYTNVSSMTVPTTNPGGVWFQAHDGQNGNYDALILKFCPDVIPLVASIQGEDVKCFGDSTGSAVVTPSGGEPGYTYSWSPYGGTDSTATNLIAGTYTVTIKDTDDSTYTTTVTINEPTALNLSSTAPYSICLGDSITLGATVSGGTPNYTYNWNAGASSDSSYTVNPTDTTNYRLVITDDVGCKDSIDLMVNVVPEITATVSAGMTLCKGESDTLIASGGSTYSWTPATGLSDPNIANPIVNVTVTTTYTVTVSSGSCAPDQATVTVIVLDQVVADAGADQQICEGETANLTATGGGNYIWSTGDSSANTSVTPSTNTDYYVIVDGGSCGSDTDTVSVTVNPQPVADAGLDSMIILGESLDLIGSGGGTYSWSPGTDLSCTSCASPTASPTVTTTYILTVTENGCTSTDTIVITVDNFCEEIFVPTAFSPNNDGINDIFYVRGNCIEELVFVIFDRWGEKMFASQNIADGWDGTFKGNYLNTAVFSYYLDATLITGEQIHLEGNVSLIR